MLSPYTPRTTIKHLPMLLLIFLFSLVSTFALADNHSLIERELLFGNPEKIQGRISPDGKHVSWLASVDGVQNVWVAPTDNLSKAQAVTNDSGRGIQRHAWAFDNQHILYLQDDGGDENDHVYMVDITTKKRTDLTPMEKGKKANIVDMSPHHPSQIVVSTNERDSRLFDLYLVDLSTGSKTLLEENPGFVMIRTDNNLKPALGLKLHADGSGSTMVKTEQGEWQRLFNIPAEDVISSSFEGFSKDNKHAYFRSTAGRDKSAVIEVDLKTAERKVLASGNNADIQAVFIHPTDKQVVAVAENYLRNTWHPVDSAYAAHFEAISEQMPGDFAILSTTSDASHWVLYSDAPTRPASYYLYSVKQKQLRELFATRPELAKAPLQPMHAQEVKARDGLVLTTYLTLPPGSDKDNNGVPEKSVPMVLLVHGGPWARDEFGYNTMHQWLANRGYAVLSVNYRGSSGFGKAFTNAAIKEFAGKMHDDLIDAVNWAVEQKITAKDQVAIMGGSYGGYATLTGVTFTPESFACGVDIVGPSNLVTLIESFPDYWQTFLSASWYKFVGNPAIPEEREDMYARSAISRIDHIKVPLLIGQGENDPRVTKLESDQIVEKMQEMNKPVTYVNFPDEGHGFVRPENRKSFYAITEGFLADCLNGDYQPIGDDLKGSSLEVLAGAEHVKGLKQALSQQNQPVSSD